MIRLLANHAYNDRNLLGLFVVNDYLNVYGSSLIHSQFRNVTLLQW